MSHNIYVILHGAFAFFEYEDKILVRLAETCDHRYQVWIPFGQLISIKDSALTLTGVTGGSASLVDPIRDEMVCLAGAKPSKMKVAAEVFLPRPISITTLMGEKLKQATVAGQPRATIPTNFALKWLLVYKANGKPKLGEYLLRDTVTIISGPSGTASPGHGAHAFAATISQFDGYSGKWEVSPASVRFEPPGCSPSGGSKNQGNYVY